MNTSGSTRLHSHVVTVLLFDFMSSRAVPVVFLAQSSTITAYLCILSAMHYKASSLHQSQPAFEAL